MLIQPKNIIKIVLFSFLITHLHVFAQNTIGLPDVINYSRKSYKGGLQNWGFEQDGMGLMYIANNEGLISFDGISFKVYPISNETIVRSVHRYAGKIYAGGQGDLGYFEPNKKGVLVYHSLVDLISARNRSFGDVWYITEFKGDIFFLSPKYIFRFSSGKIFTYQSENEWYFMDVCQGELYIQDNKKGLMMYKDGKIISAPILNNHSLFDNTITGILPLGKEDILITTLKDGLYKLANSKLTRFRSEYLDLFRKHRIYNACVLDKENFALATTHNGVYIVNHKGDIVQKFSKAEGLQNSNVLSVFTDAQSNLWVGLDNGIDLVRYNSAVKNISPQYQDGSGYAALVHNRLLYAGTPAGLFYVPLDTADDLSFTFGEFSRVPKVDGQVWRLDEVYGKVFLGAHEGAFVIDGQEAKKISDEKGFWNFVPFTSNNAQKIFSGGYYGIRLFDYLDGDITPSFNLEGINVSSRFLLQEKDDVWWVSHPYYGVYKLFVDSSGRQVTKLYTKDNGLPSTFNNHIYKIKGQLIVATDEGIFIYNSGSDSFEFSPYYKKILGSESVRYLKEDDQGNIWFVRFKSLGVVDFSFEVPKVIYFPELTGRLVNGFEFVYPINKQNIIVGADRGFFNINYEKYQASFQQLPVNIRSVLITYQKDSLIFGGYFGSIDKNLGQKRIEEIGTGTKRIQFQISSAVYGYVDNIQYSFRLVGFDNSWSPYTDNTNKEYTNLPPGTYTFEVKAKNNTGIDSNIAAYTFVILPPWYLTFFAKLIYVILCVIIIYLFYIWLKLKFRKQRFKYEQEQKRLQYIHELERSKVDSENVMLRNSKLESEIQHKNTELASNAMHLVQKAQLIDKIRTDVMQVLKTSENGHINQELKKMMRNLSDNGRIDDEWKSFTMHFDKVHDDFFKSLKEKHPTITNSEIKLSAYLRMNLTTKEIAQILNISVRGVEIGRYRLRKKLQLPPEANLYDYFIKI